MPSAWRTAGVSFVILIISPWVVLATCTIFWALTEKKKKQCTLSIAAVTYWGKSQRLKWLTKFSVRCNAFTVDVWSYWLKSYHASEVVGVCRDGSWRYVLHMLRYTRALPGFMEDLVNDFLVAKDQCVFTDTTINLYKRSASFFLYIPLDLGSWAKFLFTFQRDKGKAVYGGSGCTYSPRSVRKKATFTVHCVSRTVRGMPPHFNYSIEPAQIDTTALRLLPTPGGIKA